MLEAAHRHSVPWSRGEIIHTIRPVRVTPIAHGDWADLSTRGSLGYEGGEDSPRSRRASRPRGITATIIPPNTPCRLNYVKPNEASCTPLDENGEPLVDEKTGMALDDVKIHVNKFCPECAEGYTSKSVGDVPPSMRKGGAKQLPSAALAATKAASSEKAVDPRDAKIAKLQKLLAMQGINIDDEEPEESPDFGEI